MPIMEGTEYNQENIFEKMVETDIETRCLGCGSRDAERINLWDGNGHCDVSIFRCLNCDSYRAFHPKN